VANILGDLLAVADAAGADRFAYYGYSWLALAGLQLAVRTDRLTALVMGGFPPLEGPYAQMLQVSIATHQLAVSAPSTASSPPPAEPSDEPDWSQVEMTLSETQTRQFVTLGAGAGGTGPPQAMQAAHVLRILRPWLLSEVATGS
jgi:pimeloyl-ACP methyl ester carboxylesterase